ncbi:hypothetical protein ACRAWF_18950 [Streptomyces sp. L7]
MPQAPGKGICNHAENVVATSALFRGVLDALDASVSEGVEPPPSAVPTVADGSLVTMEEWSRPVPDGALGAAAVRPQRAVRGGPFDRAAGRGPWAPLHGAGPGRRHRRQRDGGRTRSHGVGPLGTYTGWNTRAPVKGTAHCTRFSGSTFPFAPPPRTNG